MIQTSITQEMLDEALAIEKKILAALKKRKLDKNGIDSTENTYTGLALPRRFFFGTLGELVFSRYLDEKGIAYTSATRTDGYSDKTDVIIGGKTFDVKTAPKPNHKMIMIPEAKANHRTSDYYVGVRLIDRTKAEIWGYCIKNDFQVKPDGFGDYDQPTLYIALEALTDINDLLTPTEYVCSHLDYDKQDNPIKCTNPAKIYGGWCDGCKDKEYGTRGNRSKRKLSIREIQHRLKNMGKNIDPKPETHPKDIKDLSEAEIRDLFN